MHSALKTSLSLLLLPLSVGIAAEEPSPIEITLVSEARTIAPGERFSVGIRQEIKAGYHTYWKNPGTVGLPLSMEWRLPSGFQTNAIQWPTPETAHMAVYNVWGYHQEALMVVDLIAPRSLPVGSTVKIAGKAVWMCCGKSCYPGYKNLELTLPVAQQTELIPRWTRRFDATRADQPRPSDRWTLACSVSDSTYQLSVKARSGDARPPQDIRFYDYDRQISSEKGQKVLISSNSASIRMYHEEYTGEEQTRLRGILVADGEWEPGIRVLSVDIPIQGRN